MSRFATLAATLSGAMLLGLTPKAQAQTVAPTEETFNITGEVAEVCTLSNLDTDATMTYDSDTQILSTGNAGGETAGFTVSCNADPNDVTYAVNVVAAPTDLSGSETCLLLVGNYEKTATCDTDTATASFTDFEDIDGRDAGVASAESATVGFEVDGNGDHLPAGTYEYDVVITWVP